MQEYINFFIAHPIMSGAWVVLFIAVIYSFVQAKISPFTRINPQQLTQLVNREDALLVDTRPAADFNKGHIAGAINLTHEQAISGKNAKLENHKSAPIIILCASGMTAGKTAGQLASAGFENVNILSGGMSAWTGANLPVVKG
ncbi:rhodanese-like domain-containing protein [Gayadomonas joobiniege]|uniref:rhodanese-like domain-containing protein n=1 Tax=Gayadomonas joobiniege TaxID=1234606 RepID=UPI0003687094|nr:rhodanese-like domain-containing protein [Gayadomonas joobiniege]